MQRNRPRSQDVLAITSATELPSEKTPSTIFTRDTLCRNLQKVAQRRKMVNHFSSKFKSHSSLCQDFSADEISGELSTTITQVVNAWETYVAKKQRKKSPVCPVNLSKNTKLDTFGDVVGYFVNSFKNQIAKKYMRYKTDKRSLTKQFESLDAPVYGDQNKTLGEEIEQPGSFLENLEYKQGVSLLISDLRKFDKQENERMSRLYPTEPLAMKRQSHLARLFVALMNPRYKGNIDQIRLNLGWTDYIFKRNKEQLFKRLRNNYQDLGNSLLTHVLNTQHSLVGDIKDEEKKQALPKKLEVHSVFAMTKEDSKTKYSLTVSVDQMVNGKWEPYKLVKKHELIIPLKSKHKPSFDEAKTQLSTKAKVDMEKARQILMKA